MRKLKKLMIVSGILIMAGSLFASKENREKKTYSNITDIKCKFSVGDLEIQKSPDEKIYVEVSYTHSKKYFEPIFRTVGQRLILEEDFFREDNHSGRGYSTWIVRIPDNIEIDMNTGTGSVIVNGCKVELDVNTGTGDIRVRNSTGRLKLNTGTGDIEISNCEGELRFNTGTGSVRITETKGELKANSGTGSVRAANITIVSDAEFASGTGSVKVISPKGEDFDLTLSSGTGNAVLDMQGEEIKGYFEMSCGEYRGRIDCPIAFDNEDVFGEKRNKTITKSFTKGSNSRRFYISTGTGKAVLKE